MTLEPISAVGGLEIGGLAERYGTPLYVYDGDLVLARAARLHRELGYRPLRVFFSVKANPAVGLATLLRTAGVGLDACSPGDLHLGGLAGFGREEISYTGYGATDEEFTLASLRAATVVLDSPDEFQRFSRLSAPDTMAGLRVNPGLSAGTRAALQAGTPQAKFGLGIEAVHETLALAASLGIPARGLHAHIGGEMTDASGHARTLELLAPLAHEAGSSWVNIGGGYGSPRKPGDTAYDWRGLDAVARRTLDVGVELRVEPGSYFLMDTGWLISRVVAVYESSRDRPATVVTNTSTNHLPSALLYQAHHPVSVIRKRPWPGRLSVRITGNLLQAADVLIAEAELPTVRPGDLLAFGHVGAYAASRATVFNERPRPPEVLVRDGGSQLLRRAETLEDLFRRDVVE